MGQSTPTTTMAFGTFESRYAEFRAELHPHEQRHFDRLIEAARRHSNAINRRPHLDFERPVILAMMMEAMVELEATRNDLQQTKRQLDEACRVLAGEGLMRRRPRVGRGQLRLVAN